MEIYFLKAVLQVIAADSESEVMVMLEPRSNIKQCYWLKKFIRWIGLAMPVANPLSLWLEWTGIVYPVNHHGGKIRHSHLPQFPPLCYCIYSAFDSALCGAVKTNAILTASFAACVFLLGVDGNTQAKATLQTISKRIFSITCTYWERALSACARVCIYSIHTLRSLLSVSTEVAERQQQCPGLTRKRFAANELIHQQTRAGTRVWWGEGGWGGRWRETAGRSTGRAEAGLLRERPHGEMWRLWHFHALWHVLLSFGCCSLKTWAQLGPRPALPWI